MCGIFGYLARSRPVCVDTIQTLALETERRGNHAFGFAWMNEDGTTDTFKMPGAVSRNLDKFSRLRKAVAVIGHCRWATHGGREDNKNNHPHPAGKGWVVHNGIVRNYRTLIARHNLSPVTECDSEVIGLLLPTHGGSFQERIVKTMRKIDGGYGFACAILNPVDNSIALVRRGNPISTADTKTGAYFASEAVALAAAKLNPIEFPDNWGSIARIGTETPTMFKIPRGADYSGEATVSGPCGAIRTPGKVTKTTYWPAQTWDSPNLGRFDPTKLFDDPENEAEVEAQETVRERVKARKKEQKTQEIVDEILGGGAA